ncbi:RES domain-containing protein [Propylenella binzhouense]|uniref:RES domain-containing protein n=1 Tax=Propylenella binzhouense TaxID=2555902 RepID=A0A964WTI4_9HYPH|nr:RES domain-containing protein [Propylenella binzhouense]MYZ48034.1 RES domain-containing protein [Propylenella binzhouense]
MHTGFGDPPWPPEDLRDRAYRRSDLRANEVLWRVHPVGMSPVYFGRSGRYRFDAPYHTGVLYAAAAADGAFVETFGRGDPVDRRLLEDRAISRLRVPAECGCVKFHGDGLAVIRATAEVASTRNYGLSQGWAAALFEHPLTPAGICYRVRHDNDEIGYALFERVGCLEVASTERLIDFADVWRLIEKYDIDYFK